MIIGQLVHCRMVYPGNINNVVNPSDEPKDVSYHIMKRGEEIAIRYSLHEAEVACKLLRAENIEERKIFKQFPGSEVVLEAVKAAA